MRNAIHVLARPSIALFAAFAFTAGCAGHVHKGDDFAKKGDWEQAMVEYRNAAEQHPEDRSMQEKKDEAETQVAALWTKRGVEAKAAGKIGDAGEWWRRAIELKPSDNGPKSARAIVTADAAELEATADKAVADKRYQDAFGAYGALIECFPLRSDVGDKSLAAHKQFAAELDGTANTLAQKNLVGAALVTDLRALQHDPMHPTAYAHSAELRKSLVTKSHIAIQGVTMVDNGWTLFGNTLAPRLGTRLGLYPPYGPTKITGAVPAVFAVTVEDFQWWDETTHAAEAHQVPAAATKSKDKVPNLERPAQEKVVADLTRELQAMSDAAAGIAAIAPGSPWMAAAPAATPTPAPAPAKGKGAKGAKGAKDSSTPATPAVAKKSAAARVPTADEIQKKKDALDAAKAFLAQLPETVDAPHANDWAVAYGETTRTVVAKVRFEVREPDFPEPVFVEKELRVQAKDRFTDGDAAHSIAKDALELPPLDTLVGQLADQFIDGVDVLKQARARRGDRLLQQGHDRHAAGSDDEALDAYVWAMFVVGADGLPKDATALVVSHLDGAEMHTITAP